MAVEAYDDGIAHGHWVSWYRNGQIATEAFYVHGVAHGRARLWREDGTLASDITYEHGAPVRVERIEDDAAR